MRSNYVLLALTLTLTCVVLGVRGQQGPEPVGVNWGVTDSTAIVGRMFRLHIPSDAFSGTVDGYEVKTMGNLPIPDWLEFDSKENVLQGIPTPKHAGQSFLEVTARGPTGEATTTFSLFVRDVPSHTSGAPLKFKKSGPEFVRCKREEPETVATIILDTDIEQMMPSDRLALLKRFLGHMELHEDMVKVLPVGQSSMHDGSALVSGTGDCTSPKTSGTFMSWPVGCGQVKTGHFTILQRLDDDSGSGRMAEMLKCPIIGWHVTNSHIQAPKRKRRQALATATPVMTPVMPTKTEKADDKTDDEGEKMTWTVVEMATPSMIQPTATQPEMTKTEDPMVVEPPVKEEDEKPIKPTERIPPETKPEVTPAIKPTLTYTDGDPTDPVVVDTCIPGQRPETKNTFARLTYHVGDVIDFLIPEDAFVDCEVGNTRGLELMLFQDTSKTLPTNFFIQLDKQGQRIIGLPMASDIGRYKLNLLGKKKGTALINNFDFTLVIRQMKGKKKINHELSVTVDFDYQQFMSSVENRTRLASNIASVYGDSDASNLVVTTLESGSVIYGWANKTLTSNGCPVGAISDLVGKLVKKDGSLTDEAVEKLKPFTLLGAAAQPAGSCEGNPKFPARVSKPKMEPTTTPPPMTDAPDAVTTKAPMVDGGKDDKDDDSSEPVEVPEPDDSGEADTTTPKKPDDEDTTEETLVGGKKGDEGDEDDIWITTVVPAVVIVVILLIALLIACILYRKKRKGKMNMEEQNTFVNKGAPVIFPDELEDKPSDVNKPLLVEGNAGPPPQYHRGTSESPEPEGANNHTGRNNVNSAPSDDVIQEYPERPYEPPAPPVTGSSNNKQPRPTHQQQPFSQPPQILP
ncbi:dystroglycan [Aplysia californica]|uniref:Dystroglycan 1 n=1 Tax=Aplysia californica TaxID=6500 RepID=A0ABM0JN67_APLCA|nr:dystroglycan [Aplysia californica]